MPKVSFIVPAYNAERTLSRCVQSIANQSYDHIEIIIVDDGSVDGTLSCAKSLADSDKRISFIHQNNAGVSAARNAGLEIATGQYVFFCDSDDWVDPDALQKTMPKLLASNADLAILDHYRDTELSQNRKRLFPANFFTNDRATIDVLQSLVLCIQPVRIKTSAFDRCNGLGGAAWHHLIKRSLIEAHDIRFDSYLDGLLEDGYFMMNVLEKADSVAYFAVPFYHYDPKDNSSTHGYHPDFDERCRRAYERFFSFGKEHGKDSRYYQGLYARVAYFVKGLFDVDFFNTLNPYPESDRFRSFVDTMRSEPFYSSIEQLDTSCLLSKKEKMQIRLLKNGFYKPYWKLKKKLNH